MPCLPPPLKKPRNGPSGFRIVEWKTKPRRGWPPAGDPRFRFGKPDQNDRKVRHPPVNLKFPPPIRTVDSYSHFLPHYFVPHEAFWISTILRGFVELLENVLRDETAVVAVSKGRQLSCVVCCATDPNQIV